MATPALMAQTLGLTDEELEAHYLEVVNERERRQRIADAPIQAAQIVQRYAEDGGDVAALIEELTPEV